MKKPQKPAPPVAEDMFAGIEGAENIHQLTSATWQTFMKENPSVLVMFYAPCEYFEIF